MGPPVLPPPSEVASPPDGSDALLVLSLPPFVSSPLVLDAVVEALEPYSPRHVAFTAADRDAVKAFYEAALAAGGKDNGEPGLRPIYHEHYFGAFVLDPDGNNVEAVCHAPTEN